MSNANLGTEKIDLSGIYSTCTENFSWDIRYYNGGGTADHFIKLCSNFKNVLNKDVSNSWNFVRYCGKLGLYLENLENKKSTLKLEPCCKLFYYKLKKDIIDNFSLEYTDPRDCYGKMTEQDGSTFKTKISSICMDYFVYIDSNTSTLLDYILEIYEYINLFKNNPLQRTTVNVRPFTKKIEKLEEHPYEDKNQIKAELEKIIKICSGYKNDWNSVLYGKPSLFLLSDDWINERKVKLNELVTEKKWNIDDDIETLETKEVGSQALMDTGTDGVTNGGKYTGTVFISFSIL
ncbi:variable surface protein, partial [Plasmodium gonderi]